MELYIILLLQLISSPCPSHENNGWTQQKKSEQISEVWRHGLNAMLWHQFKFWLCFLLKDDHKLHKLRAILNRL